MSQDPEDEVEVEVGDTYVRIDSETYEIDHLAQASMDTSWDGVNKFGFALVVLGGLLLAFLAPLGAVLIVIVLALILRRTYSVRLYSSTDEEVVLSSRDKAYVSAIVDALREALADLHPETSAAERPVIVRYDRVRGWLLLLCIGLTIISPAFGVLNGLGTLGLVATEASALTATGVAYLVMDAVISFVFVGFAIYAGVSLWRIRPGALNLAKLFLVMVLVVSLAELLILLVLNVPAFYKDTLMPFAILDAVRAFIFFLLWFNYLDKSKRVLATYGGLESTEWTGSLPANAVYICPGCSAELELEEEELDRRQFTCPACGLVAAL
jgi:hypothetical protein